jgi:hypothetical protein
MAHPTLATVFVPHDVTPQELAARGPIPRDCEIFFVECSPASPEHLETCCKQVRHVHVWDHHPRARALAAKFSTIDRALHKSVSTLAGASFNTSPYCSSCTTVCREFKLQLTEQQCKLFARVQDHELGTGLYLHSHGFAAAIARRGIDYRVESNPWLFGQLSALDPDELEREAIQIELQAANIRETTPTTQPLLLWDPPSPPSAEDFGEEKSDFSMSSSGGIKIIFF